MVLLLQGLSGTKGKNASIEGGRETDRRFLGNLMVASVKKPQREGESTYGQPSFGLIREQLN